MASGLLLAVNINNTLIKLALYRGVDLLHHWRIATDRHKTADEYAMLLRALFASGGAAFGDVGGVAIASVVPPLMDTMERLCRQYLGRVPLVVGPGVRTGMRILYENPKEVGADRICNAVAAYARYGGPVIVVDLGTATTFSVVSAEGDFLGGAIAPGVGISVEALAEHAAQLHRVELVRPRTAIGRSTVAAMQSGIVFGFVGQVEELLRRMQEELGRPAVTVATGGWAELILQECRSIMHHEPLLALEGLRLIYERNREPTPVRPSVQGQL
jgi:type III pantothenate kinase